MSRHSGEQLGISLHTEYPEHEKMRSFSYKEMSLKKQSLFHSAGSLALMGFQWLISVSLVRISGYEDAGVFSLAMSLSNIFTMIANYGIRNLILTDYRRKYSTAQYMAVRAFTCAAALLVCLCYINISAAYSLAERLSILFYLIYSLATIACDTLMAYVQLNNHLEINGISNIIRGCLGFAAFIAVIFITRSLVYAMAAMAVASVCVFLFFDVRKFMYICGVPGRIEYRQLGQSFAILKDGFPVMLSLVIPVTITAIPRIVIQSTLTTEMLGYFSSIYTPAVLLSTVIPPLLVAGIPEVSRAWHEKQFRTLRKKLLLNYGIVVGAVIAALVASIFLGRVVLRFVFGEEILQYYHLLYFAILTIGLNCFCVCGNNIIVAIGNKKLMVLFSMTALLITWIGSGQMIESYGIYGAAFIAIIAYGIQSFLQIGYILITIIQTRT